MIQYQLKLQMCKTQGAPDFKSGSIKLLTLFFLCSVAWAHTVTLTWVTPDYDTIRYSVYRQNKCIGAFVKRVQVLETTWTDTAGLTDGEAFCYYVTATNKAKVESEPSTVVQVQIPTEETAYAGTQRNTGRVSRDAYGRVQGFDTVRKDWPFVALSDSDSLGDYFKPYSESQCIYHPY
jgi:hypothetical protein